jgi:hypothetical protein
VEDVRQGISRAFRTASELVDLILGHPPTDGGPSDSDDGGF